VELLIREATESDLPAIVDIYKMNHRTELKSSLSTGY